MTKTTKQRFTHPALDAMEAEKRALHGVLKAIAALSPADQLTVLGRAMESVPQEDHAATADPA
jgi:hypothetical protein